MTDGDVARPGPRRPASTSVTVTGTVTVTVKGSLAAWFKSQVQGPGPSDSSEPESVPGRAHGDRGVTSDDHVMFMPNYHDYRGHRAARAAPAAASESGESAAQAESQSH